ncbi:MAG TPA: STM3941 family protein [Verrucomicrobiae bacterium]|jgi:hypothetical protein|nr:STM3941 family protein [Verrucomicrobiae bacterium]
MNRGKDIGLTIGSLVFVAGGIFLLITGDPSDRLMAIGVTAFFGACALIGLMQLIPSERVVLDADGGFTIKPDRIQMLGMAVGALGMAAGCYIFAPIAAYENRQIVSLAGYAGALFFGLGGLFLIWRAFTDKPLARIDGDGVRTFGIGAWSFAWREISGINIVAAQGQRFLSFEPNTVDILPNSGLGYTIGVHGSRLRLEDLQGAVFDLWQRHRDASAPAALQH